jgi:predicted nucleic acid-binding protein
VIWVIDASVAIRWFLKDEAHSRADTVLRRLIDQPEYFAVPELFAFEVYAVLCRLHPLGDEVFLKGVIPLLYGGLFRQPMTETMAVRAARYVKRGLTGYDACYVALAEELSGIWITFDAQAHQRVAKVGISHDLTKGLPKGW